MSRYFPGTAEELDSDLLMVWQALNDWEKIDGEWGQKIHHLKNDIRKRQVTRRMDEETRPSRTWVKWEECWKIHGYPFQIRLYPFADLPWAVVQESEPLPISKMISFDSMDKAKAFIEKRCNDIDLFEVGP